MKRRKAWSTAGLGSLVVSVNLSPREFRGRSLLPIVSQALIDSGLDAECLEVEITEASLMRDLDKAEQVLVGLQTMGVRIALDNFGTGLLEPVEPATLSAERSEDRRPVRARCTGR